MSECFSEIVGALFAYSELISAILGALLTYFIIKLEAHFNYRKIRKTIKAELETLQAQIPDKIDICKQILEKTTEDEYLSGMMVSFIDIGYRSHIDEIYSKLDPLERNCLHVIYEKMRVSEHLVSEGLKIETDSQLNRKIINLPEYRSMVEQTVHTYEQVDYLITGYLDGRPEDVFHINSHIKKLS